MSGALLLCIIGLTVADSVKYTVSVTTVRFYVSGVSIADFAGSAEVFVARMTSTSFLSTSRRFPFVKCWLG